jgi:ankyrin repeat protein
MMACLLFFFLAPLLIAQDLAKPVGSAQRPAAKQGAASTAATEDAGVAEFATGYSGHYACRTFSGVNRKLAEAVSDLEPDLVAQFLRSGADVNARADLSRTHSMTLLQTAVWHDWGTESIQLLLDAGADVDARDARGETALTYACQNPLGPDPLVVKMLIQAGANVNARGSKGRTPVMFAALCDHTTQVVELLLKSSAEVSARDSMGWTALMHATRRRQENLDAVRTLVRAGADVNASHKQGGTALSVAAHNGHTKVVQFLIEAGANVNASDTANWTPLICSSLNGHLQIVELLLKSGANVDSADRLGRTALTMAQINQHHEIEKRLVQAGAKY